MNYKKVADVAKDTENLLSKAKATIDDAEIVVGHGRINSQKADGSFLSEFQNSEPVYNETVSLHASAIHEPVTARVMCDD